MDRRSTFIRLALAGVTIGGILLALGLATGQWQSDSLAGLHRSHLRKQAKLLSSLLATAIQAEDDLQLVNWLGQVNDYGFQRGLIYDLDGSPLHASQPKLLDSSEPLSSMVRGSLQENISRGEYTRYDSPGEQRLFMVIYGNDAPLAWLELVSHDPESDQNLQQRSLISHFLAFVFIMLISGSFVIFERRQQEGAPAADSDVVTADGNKGNTEKIPNLIWQTIYTTKEEYLILVTDNRILFSSPRAREEFSAAAGKHLIELESSFPDSIEDLARPGTLKNKSIHSTDGTEWRLSLLQEGPFRLIILNRVD